MGEPSTEADIFVSMILCREVLFSKQGLPTAFTIINQVGIPVQHVPGTIRLNESEEPRTAQMKLFSPTQVSALISIYTEREQSIQFALKLKNPNGHFVHPEQSDTQTLNIRPGDLGTTFDMRAEINPSIEGLYWFEIHANEKLVTKTPFRIIHAEQIAPKYTGFEETHSAEQDQPDALERS